MNDTVTIRKTHLFGIAGLLIGCAGGLTLGSIRSEALRPSEAQAVPAAVTTARPGPQAPPAPVAVDIQGQPARGPAHAPVTIVEFTDYSCPYCKQHASQTLPQLMKEYEGQVRYVVRNFPIHSLHPFAQKAAEAAGCAQEQGKFWEFHHMLFSRAPEHGVDSLKAYAARAGLNPMRFNYCLKSGARTKAVERDIADGIKYGVGGTPTFFVNGRILSGAQPIEAFRPLVRLALESSGKTAP